jgi:hypothetical protein
MRRRGLGSACSFSRRTVRTQPGRAAEPGCQEQCRGTTARPHPGPVGPKCPRVSPESPTPTSRGQAILRRAARSLCGTVECNLFIAPRNIISQTLTVSPLHRRPQGISQGSGLSLPFSGCNVILKPVSHRVGIGDPDLTTRHPKKAAAFADVPRTCNAPMFRYIPQCEWA